MSMITSLIILDTDGITHIIKRDKNGKQISCDCGWRANQLTNIRLDRQFAANCHGLMVVNAFENDHCESAARGDCICSFKSVKRTTKEQFIIMKKYHDGERELVLDQNQIATMKDLVEMIPSNFAVKLHKLSARGAKIMAEIKLVTDRL